MRRTALPTVATLLLAGGVNAAIAKCTPIERTDVVSIERQKD